MYSLIIQGLLKYYKVKDDISFVFFIIFFRQEKKEKETTGHFSEPGCIQLFGSNVGLIH